MKKQYRTLISALGLFLLMAGTALAKDIVIFNGADFAIERIYMSDSDDDGWGDDLLNGEMLAPGEGLKITISGTPDNLDLSLYDDEDQELIFHQLDFTDFESLTVFNDGTGRFE